jgi:thioesterase domain-containing protein
MQPTERIEALLREKIPLTRAMGVRAVSYDGQALVLAAPIEANHNHLHTAFGGSLHALLTLSCYGWLWLELNDPDAHIVIRESTIRYLRPVRGELRAGCRRPKEEQVQRFKRDFEARQKARITLEATIDEEGVTAVQFTGQFVAVV